MLSIGKVGGGSGDPRYYIDNVAQGKEDYYSGRGESPGRWLQRRRQSGPARNSRR